MYIYRKKDKPAQYYPVIMMLLPVVFFYIIMYLPQYTYMLNMSLFKQLL